MFESLKKKSYKNSLILTIILLVIGIPLTACFALGTWYVTVGYVPFAKLEPDQISHQWVALNLEENWGSFAQTRETNNMHVTSTKEIYYVILTGEDYTTDFRYMAVSVPPDYEKKMDQMAERGAQGKPLFLSGRIRKMGSQVYQYFKEYMLKNGFTEEQFEQSTLPYYIQAYSDEQTVNTLTVAAFLLGVLLLLLAVIRMIRAGNGCYLKQLRADIASIGISEASADSDWNAAAEIYNGIKVGRLFTYYMEGSKPRAIPNTRILWAYQNTTTHRTNGYKTGTTYSVMIWTDGRKNAVTMGMPNEATAQAMLRRLETMFPWAVVGYSDELHKMYHNNRAHFLQLRYNTVEHNAVMPGFEGFRY